MMWRLLIWFFFSLRLYAVIGATTQWQVAPAGGAAANGGGFTPLVGTKTITAATDLTVNATDCHIVTSATHNFVSSDNSKYIAITAGTGWAIGATAYYQIQSTAANAATLTRCPTNASNANLGTYDLYDGLDYPYKSSAVQVNIDNITITATTAGANSNVITFNAAYTVVVGDNGNIVDMSAGTNINAGHYEITSVTTGAGGTWTVTGATNLTTAGGAGSALVGKMGGAKVKITDANAVMVAGNTVWLQGTGTADEITSTGVTLTAGSSGLMNSFIGYTTTRYDGGKYGFKITGNVTILTGAAFNYLANILFDANAAVAGVSARCLISANSSFVGYNLECKNAGTSVTAMTLNGNFERIWSHANGTSTTLFDIVLTGICIDCIASDSVRAGFSLGAAGKTCIRCISANHTGSTSDGFSIITAGVSTVMDHCAAVRNARDGIRLAAGSGDATQITNTIFSRNSGIDLNQITTVYNQILADYNAFDTTGTRSVGVPIGVNDITLTADPFVSATTGNFALNTTAGGGATIRQKSYPGILPNALSTSYADIGAVQSPPISGGASVQ